MKSCQHLLVGLFLLTGLVPARGDLVLTNFNAAKPIKVMPIGDSITDDCALVGAWRSFLQPLLETNGYPFTFVGRQVSSPLPGFTKVHHEGYCGAVIAPPGLTGAHGYSDADGYLQKIVADALAVTANLPDLVLLLIGANDIGRGRNPWLVATNDMPNLLNLIFSNAPNANIILAKITSLQSGSILGYGSFATNVPIYNAALQAMVNQRRALGQNVFLSDMFSVVDYNTMFLPDHVHPSAFGLKPMAAEWLARIQAITRGTNQATTTLIHGGDTWKYSDTGQDPGTNWTRLDYDDSGWSNGLARLGYGDLDDATTTSFGPDAANKYVTTYFRHSFVVPGNVNFTNLNFRLAQNDGAAVWLNSQELFRTNLPAGPLAYTNRALTALTGYTPDIFYSSNLPIAALPSGTNLIAVEVHTTSPTNSSLGFDLELIGAGYVIPPPPLSIGLSSTNIVLSWPATNGAGFTLYSAASLSSNWAIATPAIPAQTNAGQISVTISQDAATRFFRLQKP